MRATRRTFRTAAIATGAIAALAVPATAAFASDAPSPSQGQVTTDDQGTKDQATKDQTKPDDTKTDDTKTDDSTKTDENKKPDDTKKDEEKKEEKKDDAEKDTDTTPKPGSWESKGTTDLGNGWSAKVQVNVSARTAKATLTLNGAAKGSLTAYEKAARTTVDGNTFTLTPDGTISMKAKPVPPKPVHDKRVHKATVKLADGSVAKIYKLGPHHYQADIFAHGSRLDTLDANGKAAYGQNNGLHVVLNPDGTIKSWVEGKNHHDKNHHNNGTKPQPVKPQPKNGSHQVVPKGGVKAGAEGVTAGSSEDAPLIAAGSGMAALGAGGLGFALYRRRQNG
ncbi:hypothetical protein GKQ77_28225 [Streptomyces sp. BG9H]|uniref:Gram-positive cocci surface proteins LPxTG domain-containing protein n=1 Tax=Streptomyces anatolicus TaxID=2675858 RepID=A0ABS6YVD4_9ACTN|nr:hypothetical protein [Streptomyces anatolicus]MBW5425402.1 hypothetical protein [Streptomyces anatolicus]